MNNSIEDIIIDKDYNKNSKQGKPFLVVFMFFIILASLAFGAYTYYININKETNKELFLKGISNAEFKFFIENEIYEAIIKKISEKNFQMDNEVTVSNAMEIEEIENSVDLSRFLLNSTTVRNKEEEKLYNELNLFYSDNKLLNLKLLDEKDKIAIMSDEIVNKYLGIYKENANVFFEKFGVSSEFLNKYNELKDNLENKKINLLDEQTKKAKLEEYANFLIPQLAEEKFTSYENQISLVKQGSEELTVNAYKLILSKDEFALIFEGLLTKLRNDTELLEKLVTNSDDIKEIQEKIDKKIEDIKDYENGLEITVYVSEFATEKISVTLPNKDTIDIEFNPIADNEKNVAITYLYEKKNQQQNDVTVYSALENTIVEDSVSIIPKTNGIKLELYKLQNTASTTIKAVCNIIEDKEINKKIHVNITTKGTKSSKTISNDIILTYSNNDGEVSANIKSKINFDKISDIEYLTDENCLFLDILSDEDLNLNIEAIRNQILKVYMEKLQNLNFININTQAPDITENNVNRDELRNLLINTVSLQMGEAQMNGEEYTIQNLQNLQIEGHMVGVFIIDNVANINIDGVKFKIDENFNLTDA